MRTAPKRTVAIAFAALLVIVIVLVAATMGVGKPGLPDGAVVSVEEVEDGTIAVDELQRTIEQLAARQEGSPPPPDPGTPQYNMLRNTAVNGLIETLWLRGEAAERGIVITEREVDARLEMVIEEQLGGQQQFEEFLETAMLTEEEAREQLESGLLTERLQEQVVPAEPEVSQEEIQTFYDDNIEQFQTPETRDVRTLLNPDEAAAQEAFDLLTEDSSAASWKQVTADLSTDEATRDLGGLRQGLIEGQNEPALDEAIFGAEEGELIGPIEGEAGFYVAQVETINAAATQPLDEPTTDQISQSLASQKQQEAVEDFQESFLSKWRSRTVCSEDLYASDDGALQTALAAQCTNVEPPSAGEADGCIGDDEDEELQPDPTTGEPAAGCGAFVPSTLVVPPLSEDETAKSQGPLPPPVAGLPEGAVPLGVPGAPGTLPPGAVPPGTAPPGAVPPGAAPPGAVPPGAAPPGAAPPGAVPPGAAPPGAVPPGG